MKEVGSGSELGSESVEKELEAEAIFFKIRRFWIFKLATTVGVKCNNNNNNMALTTRTWLLKSSKLSPCFSTSD